MESRLLIDFARLDPDGETLRGEVDAVDLCETYVHPFGGVRYDVTVQVFGTELLVRGRLEQDFELYCSRCGKIFDTTVKVDDFVANVEISDKAESVDLTEEVRESIILALPHYPVCEESCAGLLRESTEPPPDSRWLALDGLEVK